MRLGLLPLHLALRMKLIMKHFTLAGRNLPSHLFAHTNLEEGKKVSWCLEFQRDMFKPEDRCAVESDLLRLKMQHAN